MPEDMVEDFGWHTDRPTHSTSYIAPRVKQLLSALGVHRIADLGAGNGGFSAQLAAEGYDVVGIECDAPGVEIARRAHPSITFYRYGVHDDPGELMSLESPFEAVISTEVVEHLFSPHLLPRFAARIVAPGGYLIVTTPYHGYVKNLALAILDKWDRHLDPMWHGGHIKFWSRKTLTQLLESNGFTVTHFSGVGRLPYLWKSMILVARKV